MRCCAAVALLFNAVGLCSAYSQSSATIKMDHGDVTAGDTVNMVLTFDQPATCRQQARIYMVGPRLITGNDMTLDVRGVLDAGSNTTTLTVTVPKDYQGEFHSTAENSILFACDGYSVNRNFSSTPVSFNVRGIPDPNKYPAKAAVVLSLTQKQFLDTKVTELKVLSSQIDTRVEEDGNDTVELRAVLAGIVEKAEADLQVTVRQYRTELLKPTDPLPAFFADFSRQYSALHDDLTAPFRGTRANIYEPAHLLYVQQTLKHRSPSEPPPKGRNISGTSPAIARATKETVDDNAAAYTIINSTGRALFHAQFMSFPTGATLYYRQAILPDFNIWSGKTNISDAEFELATFVFKFHKDDCEDEPVVTIDPYEDTRPIISVEFRRCGKE
jgi:hypothetical protein